MYGYKKRKLEQNKRKYIKVSLIIEECVYAYKYKQIEYLACKVCL